MKKNNTAEIIQNILEKHLTIVYLEIIDDSAKHKKHKHFNEDKKYFTLKITALEFEDKSLLECHKAIYRYLDGLIKTSIHALSIKIIK